MNRNKIAVGICNDFNISCVKCDRRENFVMSCTESVVHKVYIEEHSYKNKEQQEWVEISQLV